MRFSNTVRFCLGFVVTVLICLLVHWLGAGAFERGPGLAALATASIWLGIWGGVSYVMLVEL